MKISKLFYSWVILTLFAGIYVHQRVELIKTGYDLEDNRRELSSLIDLNSRLMYNLTKLESPRNLLASLENKGLEFANHRNTEFDDYKLAQAAR